MGRIYSGCGTVSERHPTQSLKIKPAISAVLKSLPTATTCGLAILLLVSLYQPKRRPPNRDAKRRSRQSSGMKIQVGLRQSRYTSYTVGTKLYSSTVLLTGNNALFIPLLFYLFIQLQLFWDYKMG